MGDASRLQNRDFVLIIDKSGSMDDPAPNYKSRWEAAKESTLSFARKVEQYDPDGLTLHLFSSKNKPFYNVKSDKVKQIFSENEPGGGTNLHLPLKEEFTSYLERKKQGKAKDGMIVIVVTDGEPSDEKAVAAEIVKFTKSLDKEDEVGVTFFQVGNDAGAQRFLQHLDDGLKELGAKFDIVDTKTFDEIEDQPFADVLLAALDD